LFARAFLHPFFVGDALEPSLTAICEEAFDFPAPLVQPDPEHPGLYVLELFHGPTAAFKDFGARFLMSCLSRASDDAHPMTVLVATSGDTGGAVGCASEGRPGLKTVILFPRGRISPLQEKQLTCWGENVTAIEVDGDFDDCQRLVKEAFADQKLAKQHKLASANSINVGRLLPQAAYLARAAFSVFAKTGKKPGLIIPTGNLGHGFGALLARAVGAPIGPVVLATNANRALKDWALTGKFEPRPSMRTIANAMDVGNPSNFERLNSLQAMLGDVVVESFRDDDIRTRIRHDFEQFGYIWCPHSATAAEARSRLSEIEKAERPWIVAATAHPYKFAEIVEPLIGEEIPSSDQLVSLLERDTRKLSARSSLSEVMRHLSLTELT
jgi:threonine synthase